MYKLSEMFGQRGGSDAFGRRAVIGKNIGTSELGRTLDKHLLKLAPLVQTCVLVDDRTASAVGAYAVKVHCFLLRTG